MQRVERQKEIAVNAANENRDTNETKMQENFLAQKLWSSFLKTKMEREMNSKYETETAFQKIKAETHISDVQEIVQKFLTREITYSQLLSAVSENEEKIDQLRRDNETHREKLLELQMDSAEDSGKKKNSLNPELNSLDARKRDLTKQAEKTEETNKKV